MISARLSTRLGMSTLAIVFAFGAFTPAATAKGLPSEWLGPKPPGGLFVLTDPFGSNPDIRDLLADSTVADGRLKGQRLTGGPKRAWKISFDGMGNQHGEETEGGSFLSPDVSFDGKRVAFAYVECRGDRTHRHHTDPTRGHWDPGRCYHVFTVSADGSDLQMLTEDMHRLTVWLDSCSLFFGVYEKEGGRAQLRGEIAEPTLE